jgi:hypothetical protein
MVRLPLVVHERLGVWARQIRPRLASWPVRVVETRSVGDLTVALAPWPCPLAVIDVGKRARAALEALQAALVISPGTMALVIDASAHPALALVARELGATHVLTGAVPPPLVASWLARWIPLALRRAEAEGWSADREGEPEPWDGFLAGPAHARLGLAQTPPGRA